MRIIKLRAEHAAPGLDAITIVPQAASHAIGPYISITRFSLTARVFPPHPHAGFTAMTYVLPSSPGSMLNRDSLGGVDVIEPGGAHWTIANAGMMHEETPLDDGVAVEGFQIFVNEPSAAKRLPPGREHAKAADLPHWVDVEGVRVKTILGEYGGRRGPAKLPAVVDMIEFELPRHGAWTVPRRSPAAEGALYLERGSLSVDGQTVESPSLIEFAASDAVPTFWNGANRATLYWFAGVPIGEAVVAQGPFVMNDREGISEARRNFSAGRMGRLPPRG